MSGIYGISVAATLLEKGKYDQAAVEATKAIEKEDDNPEHWFERASAYAMLERFVDAVADYDRALELDREARVLDEDVLDDAYFSALLGAARKEPLDAGLARLAHYARAFPSGRHLRDADDWSRRLRGELKSEFVKRRLDE
ncbi:MAG TPA: tetratricopeptide repeat protein [Polyangia bacterium]|nr:tetratricopeptide repeat protein [Polyangia bacterium]